MKNYEGSHTYQHSWQQIAIAFWNRYPNKYSKHVLSEDIIDRKVDNSGQLVTKRLFVKTNSTPRWIERLMKTKNVHILEESFVDPIKQTLTTITRNLGMTNLMSVEETCVYRPHPENKVWTIVERKASFDSKLSGLKRLAILTCGFERYKYNIRKTDSGFQQVIRKLQAVRAVMTEAIPISDDRVSISPQCLDVASPSSTTYEDANDTPISNFVAGDAPQQEDVSMISDYEDAADDSESDKKRTTTSTDAPSPSKGSPMFKFGPYVPILIKNGQIIIDPSGILDYYNESSPTNQKHELTCDILPEDAIVDSPSQVTPLLLKKRTVWPPNTFSTNLSVQTMIDHSIRDADDCQATDSSNDIEIIKVINKETSLGNDSMTQIPSGNYDNINMQPERCRRINRMIQAAAIASMTHSNSRNINKPLPILDDCFKSSVGQLLQGIGLSRVMEFNLENSQKRLNRKKKHLEKQGDSTKELIDELESIQTNLSRAKINNKAYKFDQVLGCPKCNFKSESSLVMIGHLEVPHKVKRDYLCSWCDYKTNDSSKILFHCFMDHKKRCRTEKPPCTFQCRFCTYENRLRTKLEKHMIKCEQLFPHNSFLSPTDYYSDDYPCITAKFITQENIRYYDKILKTLRLSTYSPHHIKISGYQQPITVVSRQYGSSLKTINDSGIKAGNYGKNKPTASVRCARDEQAVNSYQQIADQRHAAQLMNLISVQSNYPNQPRASIVQYPKAQSTLVNVRSVMQSATDFVIPPRNLPVSNNLINETGDGLNAAKILPQPEDKQKQQTANPASNTKGSTFVICEICDGYIKDLSQLKSHMQWVHKVKIQQKMLLSRPPLNCQKCQWRFFTDQGLERHLLGAHGLVTSNMQEQIEQGADSGRCTICGKAFANKLVAHMKEAHKSSLKPAHLSYKCTVCAATFNLYRLFENHVYSVHSDSIKQDSTK